MPENTALSDAVGKVVQAHGMVRAESGADVRTLEAGSDIFQGDVLVTANGSGLEVLFNDSTALSQGENSEIRVDSYVYNASDPSQSDLLLQMTKGVFRTVTGEIAEQNPDHFLLKSPLATIGIRGTTVLSEIGGQTEKHGVEEIGPGKVLVISDAMGNIQFIDAPKLIVDIVQGQAIRTARPLTQQELDYFRSAAPITSSDDDDDVGEDPEGEEAAMDGEDGEDAEASEDDGTADDIDVDGFVMLGLIPDEFLEAQLEVDDGPLIPPIDPLPSPPDDNTPKGDPIPPSEPASPSSNIIEGTSGADNLSGTDSDDTIYGYEGNDSIDGGAGNDSIEGGAGTDAIDGGTGDDYLDGGDGRDSLIGGDGADTLDGGDWDNTHNVRNYASYEDDSGSVEINIDYTWENGSGSYSGTANDGWGNTDTLIDIDRMYGSAYDDTITININDVDGDSDNRFYIWGGDGDDIITGTFDEHVRVMYFKDPSGVDIDLENNTATDGWGKTDTLTYINAVGGSDYDDYIDTSVDGNGVFGSLGDDGIDGNSGWDWLSYGWLGEDEISYVDVDLSSGEAKGYDGSTLLFTDTITAFEEVGGTWYGNDILSGDSYDNWIEGYGGNDTLDGGIGGIDTLIGGTDYDSGESSGSDVFRLVDGNSSYYDIIADFNYADSDLVEIDETSLGWTSIGPTEFTKAYNGGEVNPEDYKVIGITDHAASGFGDVATVINDALTGIDYNNSQSSYFVVSDGTNARGYYWAGDTGSNNTVEIGELQTMVIMLGVDDLDNMDGNDVDVVT